MTELQKACNILGGKENKESSGTDSKLAAISAAGFVLSSTNLINTSDDFSEFQRIDCSPEHVASLNSHVKTGFATLDMMFGCNGLPSHRIIDLTGCSGSGKTTLCISCAISTAVLENKRVYYLDTSNVLTSLVIKEYLIQLTASTLNINKSTTKWSDVPTEYIARLENLIVYAVFDYWSVVSTLSHIASIQQQQQQVTSTTPPSPPPPPPPALLVMDSLSSILKPFEDIPNMSGLVTNLMLQLRSFANQGAIVLLTTTTPLTTMTTSAYNRYQKQQQHSIEYQNVDQEMPDALSYFHTKTFGTVMMLTVDISIHCVCCIEYISKIVEPFVMTDNISETVIKLGA